jgi:hypothetical protein
MIYGPFDLSSATGATTAEAIFHLWRQIEITYDYLYFGASSDGIVFSGWRWDGTVDWENISFYLEGYIGDPSVWVGWYFFSDGVVQYEGPWIDNILIWRYVPGQVTAQGVLEYADRNGAPARGRFTTVHLYDQDPGGTDDLLATTTTDANGFFQFPARTNWDIDGTESSTYDRRLDLYAVFEADYNDSATSRHRVTNFDDQTYKWNRDPITNAPDGIADLSTPIPVEGRQAMWIFQDLRRAWEYVTSQAGIDPGSVTARWEKNVNCYPSWPVCSSYFNGGVGGPYVFIAHDSAVSSDVVVHETGHHYMWKKTNWWWWDPPCWDHELFSLEDVNCAWSEGWADFVSLAVNSTLNPNDACFDYGIGPCGGGFFENLESRDRDDLPPAFPWGDFVEGRVAGALYDLFDNVNEGFDSATFGFAPIANIVFQAPHEDRLSAVWESWKISGQNNHHTVRAIYQNTIDYDTLPRFEPSLPDRTVLQGLGWENAIDLWAYSIDEESNDWELDWQVVYTSDWRCGVTIGADDFVDIHPQPGWLGSCDVTIRANDSLKTTDDTFRLDVLPVQAWVFLPIVMNSNP